MPTVAIGDVHGNLAALEDVLGLLLPELSQTDTLVFLGDYIDRGPDSRGCVERIIKLQESGPCSIVTLMGNHEQWMLKAMRNPRCHSWLLGMEAFATIESYSGKAAKVLRQSLEQDAMKVILEKHPPPYSTFFNELPSKHIGFFEGLQPFHRTSDVVCVHAGTDLEGRLEGI